MITKTYLLDEIKSIREDLLALTISFKELKIVVAELIAEKDDKTNQKEVNER